MNRFHKNQKDVGMGVVNKVHKQVRISLQHPTLSHNIANNQYTGNVH